MRNSSQAAKQSGFARSALCRGFMVAALSSATVLCPTFAAALGMGDITLHSALNQPLNAEIELVETAGLSAEDIVAKLASPEAFARAGIERGFFYNDLRFTPIIRGNSGVLRVVSSKPVTEPYLQFLVQLLRPNGDLQHEYTLLLDPATSPAGAAAVKGRNRESAAQAAPSTRMPVSPPASVQGKRYVVAAGDTLNSIARRVQGSGSNGSATKIADGIKALNPQTFANGDSATLQVGQSLLLPDAASLPVATAPAAPGAANAEVANAVPAGDAARGAELLAVSAIENQALSKTVDDLRRQLQGLQEQVEGRDKQISGLQTALAERQPVAPPVAVAPVSSAPVAIEQPVAVEPPSDSLLTSPLFLGAIAILLLLLGLAYSMRRNRQKEHLHGPTSADTTLIKPAQSPDTSFSQVPVTAATLSAPTPAPAVSRPVTPRPASAAPDALDGVSIYIAYGRFAEAMGILREALIKQPERIDIRVRILELLAEQGDSAGFAQEEINALQNGVEPEQIQAIRSRYPQIKPAEQASAAAATAGAAALVAPVTVALVSAQAEAEAAQLDETAAAALNPEPADDFQLNLDELSMDADWDLVDPFDTPLTPRPKPEVAPPEVDPEFASNLTEFPDIEEIPDERFLSDFADVDEVPVIESNSDALDDAFLDGFMDDSSEFDLLDLDEAPLSKVNQAQVLIDEGDVEGARELLLQVIEEDDETHQQTARELLAGL